MSNSTFTPNDSGKQNFTDNGKKSPNGWQVNLAGEEVEQLHTLSYQVALVASCIAYTGKDGVDLPEDATEGLSQILNQVYSTFSKILGRAVFREGKGDAE